MKIEINEYLLKFFHLVKDLGDIDFFWGKAKLSRTEFRILWEVANEQCEGRDIISSELARRIGITRSAVSQIVAKLETSQSSKRTASSSGWARNTTARSPISASPTKRRKPFFSRRGKPTSLQSACSRNSAGKGWISSSTKAGNFQSFAIGLPILPRRHNKG